MFIVKGQQSDPDVSTNKPANERSNMLRHHRIRKCHDIPIEIDVQEHNWGNLPEVCPFLTKHLIELKAVKIVHL